MQKFSKLLSVAAIAGAAAFSMSSAQAWWGGGPWGGYPGSGWGGNDWWNDMFGDGYGDFNMNMSGGGRGWGRGRNVWRDYHGYGPYGWGGGPWGGYPYGGYGVPYATQFTNPEKIATRGHNYGYAILPQADPNGLFSPESAEGTWVLLNDPNSGDVQPIYVEPRIVVSPFRLPENLCD